jgi:3-phosphoshikimate 1-carboxyvinyltransferase
MKATIRPSTLKGIIHAPASKSSMQRGLAAAFLTGETWDLFNAGFSNDDNASLNIIKSLGAKVSIKNNKQVTISKSNDAVNEINCGESGLGMRMFVPIAALSERNITINGEGSLLNRPMDFFDEVLPQLGVKIKSNSGKLPLEIKGPLKPKDIHIDGSMSSQFLTGLLMAYAGSGAEDVSINVKKLASKPYIDLTLQVMEHFGLGNVENRSYEEFYFHPSNERKNLTHEYEVEGDWSGGAFLLVAGAIAGPITVRGLDLTSTQADKAIVDALMLANAGIAIEAKGIRIHPVEMKGFVFDASDCPDLFPPLVALAAHCKGRTTIYGVNRLIHKESNRALTLQEEFDQMGVLVKLERDEMIIQGNGNVKGADVHSHHDHRIAMALTIAALKANDETVIENAHAVNKSYPGFFNDLIKLGADISLNNKIKLHE